MSGISAIGTSGRSTLIAIAISMSFTVYLFWQESLRRNSTAPQTRQSSVFDRVTLVVHARINEKCLVDVTDYAAATRTVTQVDTRYDAGTIGIISALKTHKQPKGGLVTFSVTGPKRWETAIDLSVGATYILFLEPSEVIRQLELPANLLPSVPPYEFGIREIGFAIVDGRLRPVVAGGELDKYDGQLLMDFIREMRLLKK